MATRAETVAQLPVLFPGATARKMFGEYGFYLGPTLVGLICDDQRFLRPCDSARALRPDLPLAPPCSGAKPPLRSDARPGDPEGLLAAVRVIAEAAPLPNPKMKKV